jgi:hypothetical protein
MLGPGWSLSPRRYEVEFERNVRIPVSAGIELDADVLRPDTDGRFPAILGGHAYAKDDQFAPLTPVGTGGLRGHMEAGDSQFFVRRACCLRHWSRRARFAPHAADGAARHPAVPIGHQTGYGKISRISLPGRTDDPMPAGDPAQKIPHKK